VIKAGGEGLERALDSFEVDGAPASTEWILQDLPSPGGYAAAGAVAGANVQWRELSIEGPTRR
jgi:hypothetical protein